MRLFTQWSIILGEGFANKTKRYQLQEKKRLCRKKIFQDKYRLYSPNNDSIMVK